MQKWITVMQWGVIKLKKYVFLLLLLYQERRKDLRPLSHVKEKGRKLTEVRYGRLQERVQLSRLMRFLRKDKVSNFSWPFFIPFFKEISNIWKDTSVCFLYLKLAILFFSSVTWSYLILFSSLCYYFIVYVYSLLTILLSVDV